MKAIRCVWQYHDKRDDLVPVFDYFRYCANEAIRVGMEKNLTSKFKLHYQMYHKLRMNSRFHSKYVYGALECAASKLKLYKKTLKKKSDAKKPYISKNHLILDNQSYKIEHDIIKVPTEAARYVFIRLNRYICEKIKGVKLGSLTITDDKIILSYSKDIQKQRSTNFIGIDRNLNNVTTYDSKEDTVVYDLSKAQKIIASYGVVKSKFRRNDSRIQKKIFQKYGKLQKNRVHDILHRTSKKITSQNLGIIMEDIREFVRYTEKEMVKEKDTGLR